MDKHEEEQYLQLIRDILNKGHIEQTRNGETRSIFGNMMRFNLADGKIPILTTKCVAWKTCLKELLWFISGNTDGKRLKDNGVKIWADNGSRQALDERGLTTYPVDDLGPIYGHQWRHFNAPYYGVENLIDTNNTNNACNINNINNIIHTENINNTLNINNNNKIDNTTLTNNTDDTDKKNISYKNQGIDQLQQVIEQLSNPATRTSRRIILSAWNPSQLEEMALPPCHILCQFNVHDGNKLSCALYQRSGDVGLGVPFNIASYAMLTHILADLCGLEAYEFVHFIGNCHIYEAHIEPLKTQLERVPFPFPTISIKQVRENINDYQVDDFIINNYHHHEPIKVDMVA